MNIFIRVVFSFTKFVFLKKTVSKISTFNLGFAMLHNTSDDQLIRGQNIKILRIYLNKI